MYIKKTIGYVLPIHNKIQLIEEEVQKGLLDKFTPSTVSSENWIQWQSVKDLRRCQKCHDLTGTVYPLHAPPDEHPPIHTHCRCRIEEMEAIIAGTGTNNGEDGADWWLKHYGRLPDYYITRDELRSLGWKSSKPIVKFAPDKMLYGGIFYNQRGHLPDTLGRIWYEADLNYTSGRRNRHRVYWSNDGLIFVTYNHGETYYEII